MAYRRLEMLQTRLVRSVSHTAGLNPQAFRYDTGAWDGG